MPADRARAGCECAAGARPMLVCLDLRRRAATRDSTQLQTYLPRNTVADPKIIEAHQDDVAARIEARLRRSGYPHFSRVECSVCQGKAILTGTVPSFHLKQVAQELAAHTPGVFQVENHLNVTATCHQT